MTSDVQLYFIFAVNLRIGDIPMVYNPPIFRHCTKFFRGCVDSLNDFLSRLFCLVRARLAIHSFRTGTLVNKRMAARVRYNTRYISQLFSAKQKRKMTKYRVVWRTRDS